MISLYFDESGNNNADKALIVGAVEVLGDPVDVEQLIVALWEDLSSRRSLLGHAGFEKFQRDGFHAKNDPPEVSTAFIDLMHDIPFRAYLHMTDRSSTHAGSTENARIGYLYEALIADLILRFQTEDRLECSIEENAELRDIFAALPEAAKGRAEGKTGGRKSLPTVQVRVLKKTDLMSVALVDYVMMAVQRWISSGRSEDGGDRALRAFREVEPSISVLYSLEDGLISSRKKPLH
jgi:hypothetical protein